MVPGGMAGSGERVRGTEGERGETENEGEKDSEKEEERET